MLGQAERHAGCLTHIRIPVGNASLMQWTGSHTPDAFLHVIKLVIRWVKSMLNLTVLRSSDSFFRMNLIKSLKKCCVFSFLRTVVLCSH